ncbi:MAG TPA: hypothetical protein VLB84_05975, partial [Bacteroidia bacterium]|nr:hypothetical protein [Bacteroidia bacterium]
SQAPHLHFEIREEQTEMPVNPYFFGYKVDDQVPPVITGITVYPQSAQTQINGKHVIKNLVPHKINGKYSIAKADSLTLSGEIGFGIQCYDKESAGSGTNNVFSVEMLSGGKRLFYFEMDKFSFDNARYVNAHIDYPQKEKRHRIIQKCFLSKNNPLSIYKGVINRGIINFDDNSIHWITFIVRDYAGNSSELVLKITGKYADKNKVQTDTAFNCLKENKFIRPDIRVNIPAEALYDDLNFNFKTAPAVKSTFSPLYYLADETVALQKSITININADALPEELQNKACIVSVDRGKLYYEAGVYTYGYVLTETKHFGKFAISADTTPPKIIPLTKFPVTASIADFRNLKSLRFRSTDDLSGIKKYRATIDGSWVLCEYDAKNDLLFHTFDDSVSEGVHQFKLEVTDDKGNSKEWKMMFKR